LSPEFAITRAGVVAVTLAAMGELLTSRRAVDLCRVGSCLCRSDAI
jgi:hypothetical protein